MKKPVLIGLLIWAAGIFAATKGAEIVAPWLVLPGIVMAVLGAFTVFIGLISGVFSKSIDEMKKDTANDDQ